MPQFITFIGYALTVITGTALIYFWQRSQKLQTLIKEMANRLDVGRKQIHYLEENLARAADKTEKFRENTQKLEQAYDETRAKFTSLQKQFDGQEAGFNAEVNRLQLRLEHQTEQVRVMSEQLGQSDRSRKEAVQAYDKLLGESDNRAQKIEREWQQRTREQENDRIREARETLKQRESELNHLRHELATLKATPAQVATAEEVQDAKRRAAHYEKLYYGMKSLREMSDDRSKNWETALRQFAVYIIETSAKVAGIPATTKREINPNAPLGPLIGEALEIAGGKLVENDGIDMEAIAQKVLSEPMGL